VSGRASWSRGAASGLLTLALLTACSSPPRGDDDGAAPEPPERRSSVLDPSFGERIERELAAGECHVIALDLAQGQSIDVAIEQMGVDVATTLVPPGEGATVTFDAPVGAVGREGGTVLAADGGAFRLEVCAPESLEGPGRYRVRLAAPRAATAEDRARFEGFVAYSRGLRHAHGRAYDQASSQLVHALSKFREAGALRPQAWANYKLGILEPDALRSAEYHRDAARLYHDVGDTRAEAVAWSHFGRSLSRGGRLAEALAAYRQSVEVAETGAPDLIDHMLENIVPLQEQLGLTLQAVESYRRRLQMAVANADPGAQCEALEGMGKVYLNSGDPARALEIFTRALELARRHGLETSVTTTLEDLGRAYLVSDDAARAAEHLEEALKARRSGGDPVAVGKVLNNLGRCYVELGEAERAQAAFAEALPLVRQEEGSRVQEGLVLLNSTLVPMMNGRPEQALAPCQRALSIFRDYGRPALTLGALHCLARARAARGDLRAAVESIREAVQIVETFRSRSALEELRAQYLADRYRYYELYVDLLVRLDALEPGRGHAAEAFLVAERSKARTLLDNLARADLEIRALADPDLVAREAELGARLSGLEEKLFELRTAKDAEPALAAVRSRLEAVEQERALVSGRIFAEYPGWTTLLESKSHSLAEIQHDLLGDGETQLVSFLLGEERSYAWIVSSSSLSVETLLGKEEIETLARRTAKLLAASDQPHLTVQAELTARELSRVLLAPLLPRLTARKVIVVKDGALHYVPFAALPLPEERNGAHARSLVERFELVEVPSASAAVGLRRRKPRAPEYRGQLALLADPVFEPDDERFSRRGSATVHAAGRRAEPERKTRSLAIGGLSRLDASSDEARRIAALIPPAERFLATGFDASRRALVDGRLNGYRVVHLVGHGLADDDLVGLVLSLYDADGRPVDGLVRGYEIYGLELDAELVVLSACRTGIGQEVRGEGLIGLSRSFLYAGASRVLASLWDIDDRATADLMERFYVALFQEHQAPARALQTAQLALQRSSRWSAPHYWAGFVLQGDAH
jgi:CHAT domain-containing protein/Tfp pilus assembly protein PilF